jgi:hypothetical protein
MSSNPGGTPNAPGGNQQFLLAQMANWYDFFALTISGLSSPNIVGGYLDMQVYRPGERVYAFHNPTGSDAAVICQDKSGNDVSLVVLAGQYTPKQPEIRYIKQSGTTDGLVYYTQKY